MSEKKSQRNWLLPLEKRLLASWLPLWHGDFLVQLGGERDFSKMENTHILRVVHIAPSDAEVLARFHELPLLPNSIDIVIISHSLSTHPLAKQILQEVYEALVPGGRVVIFGNNRFRSRTSHSHYAFQIEAWLKKMQYTLLVNQTIGFMQNWPISEVLGQLLAPGLGYVYAIVAQKMTMGDLNLLCDFQSG